MLTLKQAGLNTLFKATPELSSRYHLLDVLQILDKALFSCDGSVLLSYTNNCFKRERRLFSQQKRPPNGTEPSQLNRV